MEISYCVENLLQEFYIHVHLLKMCLLIDMGKSKDPLNSREWSSERDLFIELATGWSGAKTSCILKITHSLAMSDQVAQTNQG